MFAIYPTCFLLISVCLITALANPKRPMSFEDVLAVNRASDVQISPDGRRTAFVVDSWDRENDRFNSDIWLAYDIREPAIRLTTHPQRDGNPRWSPDSRRLAFLAERSAEAQIFMIDARGGEPLQLTSHTTSIQNFEWSPDGRFIAFIAEEPREKPEAKPPVVVDLDQSSAQLWVVEIATQQIKQLTTGSLHITAFNWSPDGSSIVFTARATPKLLDSHSTEVFITPADLNNGPHDTAGARQATMGNGAEMEPRFSPDARWISYLAHADGDPTDGRLRIHIAPAAGGEPREIGKGFNGYIRSHRWVFDSHRIVFLAGLGLNARIYTMTIYNQTPQAVTRDEGVSSSFSMTFDGMNIAYIHENPRMASEVVLLSARAMLPFLITRLNPQIEQLALGQVETVKWRSNDGREIQGLLFYPVGYQSGKKYPLLTYIYSRQEVAKGFNAGWRAFPQVYSGRGYAIFIPGFRGAPDSGVKFPQTDTKPSSKIDYDDVMKGIDELVKRGLVDGSRLAIAGWSYGGDLSGRITSLTNRFRCAAYGAALCERQGSSIDEKPPLSYLRNVKTPTLIFHGEKDERVPLEESQEIYRILKRLGVTTQLIVYLGQGHDLTIPSSQVDKMKREFAWVEKFLK